MRFEETVQPKYRRAVEEAAATILEKGNKQQRNVARLARDSDLLIRFVPLCDIDCSGVTGVVDGRATNRRIAGGPLSIEEALGEICVTFSDWCWDTAGQRGCQGTLVHEGLHAYDFAKIISTFSKAGDEPEKVYDLTLYELERRAAYTSADYLVRVGAPDYISDGLQLGLVGLDRDDRPFVDAQGIERRMQEGYGVSEREQGVLISEMLGLKPRKRAFSLSRFFGFGH